VCGITLALLTSTACAIYALVKWKRRRPQYVFSTSSGKFSETMKLYGSQHDSSSGGGGYEPNSKSKSKSKSKGEEEPLSINVAMFAQPLVRLTLADLLLATDNFSKGNIIGDGGFGTVYKARLPDGRIVAIKKLGYGGSSQQGNREFVAEMETLGKLRHRNLVHLLGYCSFGDEKLLVYEYMENGSLDLWLRNKALDWPKRMRIAIGAARGLAFLHHGFVPHVIHRDMKSSNILLDSAFEPRVADFGLARLVSASDSHVTTHIAGTFGYIPPEYGQSWRATRRGDVFSFGVVLMELVTGKEPTGPEYKDFETANLADWVKYMVRIGPAHHVLDPAIADSVPKSQMLQLLNIAISCTSDDPFRRPTMLQVVNDLKDLHGSL
jgi:serine/threonine protein kinase